MRRDTLGARREPRRPVLRWKTPAGRTEECALSNARPVTIGRDDKSTIVLESRLVSKAHALVEFRDGEYTIQDLESANGTRVNGEATSVRVLEPGDRVEVGDLELTFLDLAADGPAAKGAPAAGGSKVVRLAIVGVVTMGVMIGLLMFLISGLAPAEVQKAAAIQETLAPASTELLARLRAGAETSTVVKDVVQHATLAAVPPAQALYDEGRLRFENERWRDAALLLAATAARNPANTAAAAAFEQAAAQLDRAASRALASAELAHYGMRFEDALLHADEVLQLVEKEDPRYGRALKVAEEARKTTRAGTR
jgi:hypothetical protein